MIFARHTRVAIEPKEGGEGTKEKREERIKIPRINFFMVQLFFSNCDYCLT
jgi:hypothetical protein